MKQTLLLVALVISLGCKGQDSTSKYNPLYPDSIFNGNWNAGIVSLNGFLGTGKNPEEKDTVPIVMLVSDTVVHCINGFAARVKYMTCCNGYWGESFYWAVKEQIYLDENKKPLSKNIIVWQTK